MGEMNRKEDRADNRSLENILEAIFSVLTDREEMSDSGEEEKHGSDTDRDRRPEKVAVCHDPSERILVFTPGKQSMILTHEEVYPIIEENGENQVTYDICDGEYLISYDKRETISADGFRLVKGPVFIIALDGEEGNTTDMMLEDICYLLYRLESRVWVCSGTGECLLRLEDIPDDVTGIEEDGCE